MRGLPPNPLLTQFRKLQPSPLEVRDHLIFFLWTSRCASFLFLGLTKLVCHQWVCHLFFFLAKQAGVPTWGVPSAFFFAAPSKCATDRVYPKSPECTGHSGDFSFSVFSKFQKFGPKSPDCTFTQIYWWRCLKSPECTQTWNFLWKSYCEINL